MNIAEPNLHCFSPEHEIHRGPTGQQHRDRETSLVENLYCMIKWCFYVSMLGLIDHLSVYWFPLFSLNQIQPNQVLFLNKLQFQQNFTSVNMKCVTHLENRKKKTQNNICKTGNCSPTPSRQMTKEYTWKIAATEVKIRNEIVHSISKCLGTHNEVITYCVMVRVLTTWVANISAAYTHFRLSSFCYRRH